MASDDRMTDELEGRYPELIEVLSRHCPQGAEGKQRKTSVRVARVPAEIPIEHLPNTSLESERNISED
jgi:hypothetical protein